VTGCRIQDARCRIQGNTDAEDEKFRGLEG
jgi:hypothetical protein